MIRAEFIMKGEIASLLLLIIGIPLITAQTWWSSVAQLGAFTQTDVMMVSTKPICSKLPGLSSGQAKICELFVDHMPAVGRGALRAIEECQRQFKDRRWNCSTPYGSNVFGPVHPLGTREAAFTYALLSAGVSHEISRSCRRGEMMSCGCSEASRPGNLPRRWTWGGCGDNLEYGDEFSRNFIDIREREDSHALSSSDRARSLMNRWNNELGRKVLKRKTRPSCKCHGVSGSCNLKTCWQQMPEHPVIGDHLVEKYDDAVQVKINRRGNLQMLKARRVGRRNARGRKSRKSDRQSLDLVFLDPSPDYCERNLTVGTLGTQGRFCKKEGLGRDSCEFLCCGRGYDTFREVIREKCQCKFQWCCSVVCDMCVRNVSRHVCK